MSSQPQSYPVTDKAWGLPLAVLSLLQFVVILDGTVVNLALSRIQTDLGLTETGRGWVVSAYALTYGGLLLLGGRLGDTFGRRRMFITGVTIFTLASLVCGAAINDDMLLWARAAQGIGAAIASPTAMALVVVTFAPGKVRSQAFSIFAMMTGLGSVAGLIIGGALTQVSWRWIFYINIPFGLLIIVGSVIALTDVAPTKMPLDIRGAIMATVACTALVAGIDASSTGVNNPLVWALLGGGALLLVAFLYSQRTVASPLLPLRLFAQARRSATFIALFLVGGLMMVMAVFVALYVQEVLGFTPLQAGLAFIPFGIALAAGSEIASRLCLKIQPRWIIVTGAILLALAVSHASTMGPHTSFFPHIFLSMLVIGCGFSFMIISLTLAIVAGVDHEDVGPLTAITLVASPLGGALGLAIATVVSTTTITRAGGVVDIARENLSVAQISALSDGYTSALLVAAVLSVIVAVIAAIWINFSCEEISQAKEAEEQLHSG